MLRFLLEKRAQVKYVSTYAMAGAPSYCKKEHGQNTVD